MAAIAWSYAAARRLGVAPDIVFHPQGYKGGAAALVENFTAGRYIGVPLLQWWGMALEPRLAEAQGVALRTSCDGCDSGRSDLNGRRCRCRSDRWHQRWGKHQEDR
jgi:hypothetical protein